MDARDDEQVPPLPAGTAAALRRAEVWAEPPAALKGQVLAALRAEVAAASAPQAAPETAPAATAGAAPAPAPAPAPTDELARARRRRADRRGDGRSGWFSPRSLLAAAATVAVLAVGAIAVGTRTGDPGSATVPLAATELEPGASGTAEVTSTPSGFRIELDVSGLPPAPEGTYYQGWVKGERGLVTIGTFHGREGTDDVVLWAGVDLADYPTLTVTLQQEGAGQESSGQVVLSGPIPDVPAD
jgi:hypothetical protein